MEATKRPALPLLLGGVALCSLVGYAVGQASASAEKMEVLHALTAVDKFAITLTLVDAALLTSVASHRGPDTPWKAETYADHEGNSSSSVAEARQIFPLQNWPVDSDRAPGKRIATSCEGFKDDVQLWTTKTKCSCADFVLAAVELLSFGELQWCGEYLAGRRSDHDVGHSPYWKHRREFQTLLMLQLLEVVASLCCLVLVRWVWTLQTLKLVQYKDGGKMDTV
ncbi:hypothetical protein GQ600_6912 [Phytophthora cactorum]|nr:hypothetical protein GQ600_6912 [Phytophthora cactorum]